MSALQQQQTENAQTSDNADNAENKEATNYAAIRAIVLGWPSELRANLLHALVNSLADEVRLSKPRRPTLHIALGLASNGGPALTDEEVERMIQEHREAKYG